MIVSSAVSIIRIIFDKKKLKIYFLLTVWQASMNSSMVTTPSALVSNLANISST